ncbi:beta-ketoacyl-[acyl-carrier-protein] synthase family protein [Nocardia heshunensis]
MRIRSAVAGLPSRTVSNADITTLIAEHSVAGFDGDLDDALRKVEYYLKYAGSDTRQWLDAGERPIDLLRTAANRALEQAELRREDIDLLIYTGIGRGFIEPGGAYHSAAAIGLPNAHCFDILDACMSWTRAVQVSESLFRTGQFRNALIVNAEFNLRWAVWSSRSCSRCPGSRRWSRPSRPTPWARPRPRPCSRPRTTSPGSFVSRPGPISRRCAM